MNEYIDIGANLTGSSFSKDLNDVIQRALRAGVTKTIVTGTDVEHSQMAITLCEQYADYLYSTVGVHPHHADEFNKELVPQIKELSTHSCVVAVGECGLDYNRNYAISKNQVYAFEKQLELASEVNKPVFLHQRDAHDDFVAILKASQVDLTTTVAHCFTGAVDEAMEYVEMGMYIGVTGWICDERRGHDLQEAVQHIPLERIMLETDAPYLLPRDLEEVPVHSRRNEPCFLPHICRVTARYMNIDEEELRVVSLENTKRFFGI